MACLKGLTPKAVLVRGLKNGELIVRWHGLALLHLVSDIARELHGPRVGEVLAANDQDRCECLQPSRSRVPQFTYTLLDIYFRPRIDIESPA